MKELSRYYPPTGIRREKIKQEIVAAIYLNPNQDPSLTVTERRDEVVDAYGHLDIVIPLTEMARDGDISYNPKSGWSTQLPSDIEILPEN